jgi:C4-dicarboxylate-specific signal transduction histidine kinase
LECPDLPLIAESCGRAAEQLRRAGTTLTELRERCRARVNRDRSIDPNRLISCLTEIMAADMRAYDVELTVAYGVELPGCHGDFEGLLVVLMNLTRNAIEAMADTEWLDRHLNIESRAVLPDQVEIALQDHGPGIPADLGLEIFQPFVSGRANRMGLGLAASQALLRMRQGSLRYEPRLGGGTTFIMSLPSTTGMGAPRGPIG